MYGDNKICFLDPRTMTEEINLHDVNINLKAPWFFQHASYFNSCHKNINISLGNKRQVYFSFYPFIHLSQLWLSLNVFSTKRGSG